MIPTTLMPLGPTQIALELHLGAGPALCLGVALCAAILGALLDRRGRRPARWTLDTTAPPAPAARLAV